MNDIHKKIYWGIIVDYYEAIETILDTKVKDKMHPGPYGKLKRQVQSTVIDYMQRVFEFGLLVSDKEEIE